jgi:hypothetical protein
MTRTFTGAAITGLLLGYGAIAWAQSPAQGGAATPSKPADACFFQRDVLGFSAPDDHTVYLRVGPSDYYRLDLMGTCPNLNWSQGLFLRNRSGGPTVCSPMDADVMVRLRGAIPDDCPVSAIHKLSKPETLALGKDRP